MLPGQQRGMLTGLTDPQIASALRAFHADIRRSWSVASLSAEARMSRSVFSQRFASLTGQPPMTYALHWRMAVACDALRFSGRSLDEIALAAGYGSASAFSTAFTRTVGRPPVRFARDSGGSAVRDIRGSRPRMPQRDFRRSGLVALRERRSRGSDLSWRSEVAAAFEGPAQFSRW
jgi:AraC-like DNA-binding protein